MKRVVFMFLLSISIYNLHAQLFDSITDVRDGQKYKIIQIGNQWWMAENLNVGTWISSDVSDQTDNSTLEKYCYYDIESYCDTYGGLYFWNEMMQYNPSDNGAIGTTQGICPAGWHLPTDKEWKTLEMYLGMSQIDADGTGSRGTDEGGKLKETGTTHWNSPNNGATNETGFTGLPGGYNYCNGCYQSIGSTGFYWTATEKDGTSGIDRELSNISTRVTRWTHIPKDEGFSVRCVKDPEPLTIELSGENTTSIGGTDGSIDLSVSGGISPYSYSWSNGATVQDIDNLTAGVYSVTVTDSRDSTIIDSIRIYDTFVDSRDGQRYKAVTIGDQVWMAENLNIGIMIDSLQLGTDNDTIEKYCYHNSEDLSDIYGSLYPWEEMMDFNPSDAGNPGTLQGVCPVGWHLSTDEEWKELEMFLGMSEGDANSINTRGTSEGGKLKEAGFIHWLEPNQGATNETGFTGLPGGYRHSDNQSFLTIYEDGMFWTSTMAPTIGPYYRRLARNESGIIRGMLSKNFGFSVRCIKN